jgi:hypothetical protein
LAGDVAAIRIHPERTIRNKNLEYAAVGKKARPVFLKKRSRKLLLQGIHGSFRCGPRTPTEESFLVLFFKK